MNTFKKVALSLLVVGSAIGFSAFKNAQKQGSLIGTTYYQLSPGLYSKTAPAPEKECVEDRNPCVIAFPGTIPSGTFDTFNYPADLGSVTGVGGTPQPSTEQGFWN